ncbi:lactate/malate dehydrogenase, NAD binding domain-containing protein [Ditylenchus destructor]|uniref:Malate dehydrogenase, mitochondrial n=1 Tax=Ditylenchus destructor TaxID=166010 RepID=A0AAD4RBF3_9BILA|nr:lactate/malate dehydrogenase, NAD binding domain-containing protein [Ditylenchus destructor]
MTVLSAARTVGGLCRSQLGRNFIAVRNSSNAPKVAVIGASGGIGQPLSLLLKTNKNIAHLALYDIVGTPGVAADLSHINSPAQVTAHTGPQELHKALEGADVVVVPAGVPRKPGMTRDDLFNTNAGVVRDLAEQAAKICPKAFLAIITNPVNSTVPIAAEVYKNNDVFDPKRIFGVTSLDIVRAHTFVAELKKLDVNTIQVPVIGGHSGVTIIPLLSQVKPSVKFSDDEIKALTERIQDAGTEVVKAKAGAGSATLSMAHAGAYFANALVKALKGERSVQYSYVKSDVVKGVEYFSSPVELGPNGAEKVQGYGTLSKFEEQLVQAAIPELQTNIQKGVKFIRG